MTALWMLYLLLVTVLLGSVAALLERVVGDRGWSRRWLWLGALVGVAAIASFASRRQWSAAPSPEPVTIRESPSAGAAGRLSIDFAALVARVRPDRALLERAQVPLTIAWGAGVALVVVFYIVAALTLEGQRRQWRRVRVDDVDVLVAPETGPAVVGLLRPEVVLPEWALDASPNERALMLAHEREHARARDPLVLQVAWLAILVMPWNIAVWWVVRRLRAAVELDCDARVLRLRPDPVAYSALLLAVGVRHANRIPALAPALLERRSTLTRRIVAMHQRRLPLRRLSVFAAVTAAATGLVLACAAPSPEMLAPDGRDMPTARVMGTNVAAPLGVDSLRALIARYFPDVASGAADSSVLFFVTDAGGKVVMTDRVAGANLRVKTRGDPLHTPARDPSGQRIRTPGSVELRGLDSLMAAITPDRIASIEVVKKASGIIAPSPTSVVWIRLK